MKRSTTLIVAAGFVLVGWGVEQEIRKRTCPPGPPGPDGKPTQNTSCTTSSRSSTSGGHSSFLWGSSNSGSSHTTSSHTTSRGGWGSSGRSFSSGS